MLLGGLVVVLPFLGFPESWRVVIFCLSGGALFLIGFSMRRAKAPRRSLPIGAAHVENVTRAGSDIVAPPYEKTAEQGN